jgi:glycosyltransferase involved in cell wall biosynthesis
LALSYRTSVILSTYNQPYHLERVLWGYARQSWQDFELVVADDGSGSETRELLDRWRRETGLDLKHVWHEDRGFRKNEILNRAILATDADYLIFSDGDCVPRDNFVEVHVRHAAPGRFLSGGVLWLSQQLTDQITVDDVRSGCAMEPSWLLRRGWRPRHRRLRLIRAPRLAAALDFLTPTAATWNGHNASTWRRHLIDVNGYDMDLAYGNEDRALGTRLQNSGLRGKCVRYRAPLLHLAHERPYRDRSVIDRNRRVRKQLARSGAVRARLGIAELG